MMMKQALVRPLPPHTLVALSGAIILGLTAYCLTYNALQGTPETLANAVSWPVINILPFVFAFEFGKRFSRWHLRRLLLGAMIALSLLLDAVLWHQTAVAFEFTRRLPAILLVLFGLFTADRLANAKSQRNGIWEGELPLLPHQIDFVRAAGNYVELHGLGRTLLQRTTMAAICEHLEGSEFVRIHRSVLVRTDAVKKWCRGHVELQDGSVHRIGTRYRGNIPLNR